MKYKGAIFDVDGTLLDSMTIWESVGVIYLRQFGIEVDGAMKDKFFSLSLPETAVYFREEYALKLSEKEISDGINALIEDFYFNIAPAKKGALECLEYLKGEGVKMCVATATDKYLVERALERNGLLGFFSHIFTCTDVGAGKTSPLIFELAQAHLGTDRRETLVFEDAVYAIKTAEAAGFPVLAIYDKSADKHTAEIRGTADYYINDYSELRNLI